MDFGVVSRAVWKVFSSADAVVKQQLSLVGFTGDDDLVQHHLDYATAAVETELNYPLVETVKEGKQAGFANVLIRDPNARTVEVKYFDAANAEQTLPSTLYSVRLVGGIWAVCFEADGLPTVYNRADAVRIRYTGGYTSAAAVPVVAKQAILLLTSDAYLNREDSKRQYPQASERLLSPIRVWN